MLRRERLRMTSRERVLCAFGHIEGDRVPIWCGVSPEFWAKARQHFGLNDEELHQRFGDDFRWVWARYSGPAVVLPPDAACRSVFQLKLCSTGNWTDGKEWVSPLAHATLAQIHEYTWPDPNWIDAANIPDMVRQYRGEYAIVGGERSPFWHDGIDLMGIDVLMTCMYEAPELVDAVFGHVVDYYVEVNRQIFDEAGGLMDIFFINNDFGGQMGPLISESLFRRFIFPHLRRLVRLGHDYGMKVILSSAGDVYELLPAIVDAGCDALYPVQSTHHGMDLYRLKKEFGHRLVLCGAIRLQQGDGSPELVQEAARQVLDVMKSGSGYIAGADCDVIPEETPVENVMAMFDAIRIFGEY